MHEIILLSLKTIIKIPCFNAVSYTSNHLSQNGFKLMHFIMLFC